MAIHKLNGIDDILPEIIHRREQRHLSQGDLASLSGVSRKWLNEFEGRRLSNISVDNLIKVCSALDIKLAFFSSRDVDHNRQRRSLKDNKNA